MGAAVSLEERPDELAPTIPIDRIVASSELAETRVVRIHTLMLAAVANEPLRSKLHGQLRALERSMLEVVHLESEPSHPSLERGSS